LGQNSHGLSFITCNSGLGNEETGDGVLDVVGHGYGIYYRYVDDICTAVALSKIDDLLEQFNLFHPHLQFTSEIGDDEINYLDVTISINGNSFIFDYRQWYHNLLREVFEFQF